MRVEHRYFSVNGLRLHATDYGGAGHPILLLHDRFGHSAVWRDVAAPLSLWGTVVGVDLRGHGDSQWPPSGRYDVQVVADDVRGIAHQLTTGAIDLVGLGWGGLVALRAAADEPGLLRRLVLLGPPLGGLRADQVPPPETDFLAGEAVIAAERAAHPTATGSLIQHLAAHSTRPGPGGRLVRKYDPSLATTAWPDEDSWAEVASLKGPTLLVASGGGGALSGEDLARAAAVAPELRCETIDGGGRDLAVDQPTELADLLVEFLGEGDIDEL